MDWSFRSYYRIADTWALTAASAMSTMGSLVEVGLFQFGEQYQLSPCDDE